MKVLPQTHHCQVSFAPRVSGWASQTPRQTMPGRDNPQASAALRKSTRVPGLAVCQSSFLGWKHHGSVRYKERELCIDGHRPQHLTLIQGWK